MSCTFVLPVAVPPSARVAVPMAAKECLDMFGYDSGNKGWMFQTTTTNDDSADFPTAEGDNNTATVGTWTHLVAAFRAPVAGSSNTGNMALYQNGTLMGTATNLSPQYDSSLPLTIGGCVNTSRM